MAWDSIYYSIHKFYFPQMCDERRLEETQLDYHLCLLMEQKTR